MHNKASSVAALCGMASQTQSRTPIGYTKHLSRSHDAAIRVHDRAGKVIETHEHAGEFKEF